MVQPSAVPGSGHLAWPFHVAPWEWTLACGLLKVLLAGVALAVPTFVPHLLPPMVGWMLLAGGVSELALSWRGRSSWVGRLTFGSGAITVITGALFATGRWTGLFPLAEFVMIWLLLRGMISIDVAIQSRETPRANWGWLAIRGATDMGLGFLLLAGTPLAMLSIVVFGEMTEMIAGFCRIIAASFAVGGVSLVAIALAQRNQHRADPFLANQRDDA